MPPDQPPIGERPVFLAYDLVAVAAMLTDVVELAGGRAPAAVSVVADVWFVVAAALGALLLVRTRRVSAPRS